MRFYQQIGLANPLRPARPYFAAFDKTTHDFVLVQLRVPRPGAGEGPNRARGGVSVARPPIGGHRRRCLRRPGRRGPAPGDRARRRGGRRAARLVTVIGDPGVGKSRLAAEFTGAQGDARVVDARCDVEGTVALAPIVEVLRAPDLETDVPATVPERDRILRDLNGLAAGVPGSVEETFWALRRYIEVLASDGPLIIVVDDIQWADTLLLDFVEHLVEWVQDVPVLVLALARPELREVRPTSSPSAGGYPRRSTSAASTPGRQPNSPQGAGPARLPRSCCAAFPRRPEAIPSSCASWSGCSCTTGPRRGTGRLATHDRRRRNRIPPTIQALLASRLERLNAPDRRVLEIASVIGTDFSLGAVRALAGRRGGGKACPSTDFVGSSSLSQAGRISVTSRSGASTTC